LTKIGSFLSILVFAGVQSATAAVITLDFEGLRDNETILNFYNGGTGGSGSGPGPNDGITFGVDALALIDADSGGSGNFANEPSPNTIAYFLTGPGVVMNVAAGFDTGFSFFYTAIASPGSVNVYSGLNATGTLLATIPLSLTTTNCSGDPTGQFCSFVPVGVTFSGTAMSVDFGGVANEIGIDNITLGSSVPTPGTPEPSSVLLLASSVGFITCLGAYKRRSSRSTPQ
jgi:hypothetical protein